MTAGGELVRRAIPATGERLSVVGLGTWRVFDVSADPVERARLADVLRSLVAMGGALVDTSPMYGRAESVLGELVAALGIRPDLFLATKVWTTGAQAGVRQMQESQGALRSEVIDLLQVHNLVDAGRHLDTLQAWKREGRVRYVGITHYAASHHAEMARIMEERPLDFIQINYSVGERDADRRILPLAAERGLAVIANRPFGGGGLLARLRARPIPAWAAKIDCTSWAQILLKYVISHPAITCVIPATGNPAHMQDNMSAGSGPLPDAELRSRIVRAVA